jgi:hypothetical protein
VFNIHVNGGQPFLGRIYLLVIDYFARLRGSGAA